MPFTNLESAAVSAIHIRKNGRHTSPGNDVAELFDLVPVMIVVMDREHNILNLNQAAARTAGRKQTDCVGAKFWELFDNQDCRAGTCAAARAVSTRTTCTGLAHAKVNGSTTAVMVTAAPRLRADGEAIGVIEVLFPIQADVALSEEIERIAHCVAAGQLDQRVPEDQFEGHHKMRARHVNQMLDAVSTSVTEVNRVVKRMACNDLSQRAPGNLPGIFGDLCLSVNQAQDRVRNATRIVENIAKGDFQKDLEALSTIARRSESDELVPAFLKLMRSVDALTTDAAALTQAAVAGKLEVRADSSRHEGAFRKLVEGINATLDAVVGPLSVAGQYVDRISKGDLPPLITDAYNGDFNVIKQNLNECIQSLTGLTEEIRHMSHEHDLGAIDVVIDGGKFHGVYKEVAEGINQMVGGHISVKKKAMACVAEFGHGNYDAALEKFPGKKAFINENIELLRSNVKNFIAEMSRMSEAHNAGDIDWMIPVAEFEGAYRTMAAGVNEMVGGHISVKKKAMACIAEFGKGNFEAPLEKFPGKKAFINDTIEQVRTHLKALIADANFLVAGCSRR